MATSQLPDQVPENVHSLPTRSNLTFELNLSDQEKLEKLLVHFDSWVRSASGSSRGIGEPQEDGSTVSKLGCFLVIEDQKYLMQWRFDFTPEGQLAKVTAQLLDSLADEKTWREAVGQAWATVLRGAFVDAKNRFFREHRFHYQGPRLDGEYWIDGFRVAPLDIPLAEGPDLLSEKVVQIQHEVDAVDLLHSFDLSEFAVTRFVERASLLTGMGISKPASSRRLGNLGSPDSNHLFWSGIMTKSGPATRFPKKGAICSPGRFEGSVFESNFAIRADKSLYFPKETRPIFRALRQADSRVRSAFDNFCGMYRLANLVHESSRAASLSYRVAAIDALKSSVGARHFKEFVIDLCPDLAGSSLVEFCWQRVRSAHFHEGDFRSDRMPAVRGIFTQESLAHIQTFRQVDYLFSRVKAAWIQKVLMVTAEKE